MASDIDPGDNVELIGLAGEKVFTVRQRQDSFNRVEITADGSINLGSGSSAPSGVSQGKAFPITDFGAKPGSGDSRPALLAAMAAAAGTPGGFVWVPAGDWYLNFTVAWNPNVPLRGAGVLVTRFIALHALGGNGFTITGVTLGPCVWSDIQVITPGTPQAGTGIGVYTSTFVQFENLIIRGWAGGGLKVEANVSTSTNACTSTFRNVTTDYNGGFGVDVQGDNANAMDFFGGRSVWNGSWGVNDASALGNNYFGFLCDANGAGAGVGGPGSFQITGGANASQLFGCYAETNQRPARILGGYAAVFGGSFVEAGLYGGIVTANGALAIRTNPTNAAAWISTEKLELWSKDKKNTVVDFVLSSDVAATAFQRFLGNSTSGSGGFGMYVDGVEKLRIDATSAGTARLIANSLQFTLATKPTVTGSRGGNAALASLLTGLASLGLVTDSSTA
jgi:hypothetical protein